MTGIIFREIGSPTKPQLIKSTAMLEGVRYIQLRVGPFIYGILLDSF